MFTIGQVVKCVEQGGGASSRRVLEGELYTVIESYISQGTGKELVKLEGMPSEKQYFARRFIPHKLSNADRMKQRMEELHGA